MGYASWSYVTVSALSLDHMCASAHKLLITSSMRCNDMDLIWLVKQVLQLYTAAIQGRIEGVSEVSGNLLIAEQFL